MEPVSFTLKCAKLFWFFSFYEKHMKTMKSTVQVNNNFGLFFEEHSSKA